MPVFRVPRERLEVEVSQLEANGFRDLSFTPDGDEVIVYALPLWRGVTPPPVEQRSISGRVVLERTDVGQLA